MLRTLEEFEEKELHLECLGHFVGVEFTPKSGLKFKEQSILDEKKQKDVVLEDIPLDKANTWKRGALTASFRRFGYHTENAKFERSPLNEEQQLRPEARSKLLERLKFRSSLKNMGNCQQNRDAETEISMQNDDNYVLNGISSKDEGSGSSSNYKKRIGRTINGVCIEPTNLRPFASPLIKNLGTNPDKAYVENTTESKIDNAKSNQLHRVGLSKRNYSANGLFKSISSVKSSAVTNEYETPLPANRNPVRGKSSAQADEEIGSDSVADPIKSSIFRTAYEQLRINDREKGIKRNINGGATGTRNQAINQPATDDKVAKLSDNPEVNELMMTHDGLKMFEPAIVERILGEIMEPPQEIDWDDVAGLEGPKSIIKEIIIWPLLRPDIFKGLRAAPRGILLFGPPGTGKTMIGRLIATQSKSTFFSISASSLTSKWIGDGEKIVRALFILARIKQPSVIFIDEIDSIMTQRSDTEHESSRRMKTEFLVQFDGCSTDSEDRVLVIGVTNRPQELDDAARRRLVKRIYIPLPDIEGRKQIVKKLMSDQSVNLSEENYNKIAEITEGYSGADMKNLCHVAANEPIRDISHRLESIDIADVRPINIDDFLSAKDESSKTVAGNEMTMYETFDSSFGCKLKPKKKT